MQILNVMENAKKEQGNWLQDFCSSLKTTLPLQQAIHSYIQIKLCRITTAVLAKLSTNCNFLLLSDYKATNNNSLQMESPNVIPLWTKLFNSIQTLNFNMVSWKTQKHQVAINCVSKFPFSFLFIESIDKLRMEAENFQKG